jgi:putative membrane protein
MSEPRAPLESKLLVAATIAIFVALGWSPSADRFTWAMENFPVVLGLPFLVATYRKFPLTPLAYRLLFVHAIVLMVGGHWSYAEVPAGDWVRDALGLARNPYDRLGHFLQGLTPAIVGREILLRRTPLERGAWLAFLVVSVALAISASYELLEWWTAVAVGDTAEAFLGTQGDVWDTQWDMFMALAGAVTGLVLFSRIHDRQLARLRNG